MTWVRIVVVNTVDFFISLEVSPLNPNRFGNHSLNLLLIVVTDELILIKFAQIEIVIWVRIYMIEK